MHAPALDHWDASTRPSEFLRAAECSAVRIRKLLAALRGREQTALGPSGSMHDAERLAELVERLARYGQKVPAAEAMRIASYVDELISMLLAELDGLLA